MGLDSWLDKSGLLTVNICSNPCNEKEEAIVGLDFKRRLFFHFSLRKHAPLELSKACLWTPTYLVKKNSFSI